MAVEDNKMRSRESALYRNYGITKAEYDALYKSQGGVCAICKQPEKVSRRGRPPVLSVDHGHLTGQVRGLLCSDCNIGVRHIEKSDFVIASAQYLGNRSLVKSYRPESRIERTKYRTSALRQLSRTLAIYGGIEGRYRLLAGQRRTRREIADALGLTPSALGRWITVWNRKEDTESDHGTRSDR